MSSSHINGNLAMIYATMYEDDLKGIILDDGGTGGKLDLPPLIPYDQFGFPNVEDSHNLTLFMSILEISPQDPNDPNCGQFVYITFVQIFFVVFNQFLYPVAFITATD